MHFLHPVPQRIHHHAQRADIGEIEGVTGAGVVDVEAAIVGQAVIAGVVDPLEGKRGAELVAFGSVVVDHVQQHFQAGVMQPRDHLLKLGHGARGHVTRLRRKEAQRVVAPVIAQAVFQQILVVDERVHRQQFHCGDAERADVVD